MKKHLAAWLVAALISSPAAAQQLDALGAGAAVQGTHLFPSFQGAAPLKRVTGAQIAAYMYGLASGDATASGTGTITLATVNGNVGSFGSATNCVALTVNAKGLITAISQATCTPAVGSLTGLGPGVGTFLGTPSSANLLAALTTKTGTGNAVFGTAPTIDSLNATTAMTLAWLTGSTQCLQVNSSGAVSGTGAACGGSGSTGANPTATAGPTAVNGVATTFMRSDAAPAVQQGSASQKGIVQVDGTTIVANAGVISMGGLAASLQTGTNYPIVSTDFGKLILLSNASAQAPTLPTAASVGANWFVNVCNVNTGIQTLTPTGSQINSAPTFPIPAWASSFPICGTIQSDGSAYTFAPQFTIDASKLTAGVLAAARGGAGTINGALKGNGSGTVSQAACADLSNGATGCSTAVGTSGATLPVLNGTNTWGGTQTFGTVVGTVTTQSGTTYTLAASDCGTTIRFTNASAVTVTIPQGLAVGCSIAILQQNTGAVSVNGSAVTPATLQSRSSYTKTAGRWGMIGITIESSNVAVLTGDGAT